MNTDKLIDAIEKENGKQITEMMFGLNVDEASQNDLDDLTAFHTTTHNDHLGSITLDDIIESLAAAREQMQSIVEGTALRDIEAGELVRLNGLLGLLIRARKVNTTSDVDMHPSNPNVIRYGEYTIKYLYPFTNYKTVYKTTKSKVGKRKIRIRVIAGYTEMIEGSTVIQDKVNKVVYMNQKTFNEFKKQLNVKEKHQKHLLERDHSEALLFNNYGHVPLEPSRQYCKHCNACLFTQDYKTPCPSFN